MPPSARAITPVILPFADLEGARLVKNGSELAQK
jgi:hypothetical protein